MYDLCNFPKILILEFRIDELNASQGSLLSNRNSRWQFEKIRTNTLFAELLVLSRLDYVMLYLTWIILYKEISSISSFFCSIQHSKNRHSSKIAFVGNHNNSLDSSNMMMRICNHLRNVIVSNHRFKLIVTSDYLKLSSVWLGIISQSA